MSEINFEDYIDKIPNFPKKGILFRDIQPLLANAKIFQKAIEAMGNLIVKEKFLPDYWVGIEARGFLFASALSISFGGGVKLIRKKGKLPNPDLVSVTYDLEYGADTIEMKKEKNTDKKIVLVDDCFATGGTMKAAEKLCLLNHYEIIAKLALMDLKIIDDPEIMAIL